MPDSEDRERRFPVAGYMKIAFGVLVWIGTAAVVIALLTLSNPRDPEATLQLGWMGYQILTALALAISYYGLQRFQEGKREVLAARVLPPLDESDDCVLYLRGFVEDILTAESLGTPTDLLGVFLNLFRLPLTEEEHLVRALGAFCPVVAIGQPNERLPTLGARRHYIDQANWQDSIQRLMRRARLVVLRIGSDEGLLWELDVALRTVSRERLVLLIPSFETPYLRSLGSSVHSRLHSLLESRLGCALPPFPEVRGPSRRLGTLRGVIFFSATGRPILYRLRNRDVRWRIARYPLASALQDVFTALFARVGLIRPNHPLWFRRALAFAIDWYVITTLISVLGDPVPDSRLAQSLFHVTYWIVAEALLSRTFGKQLTGLRVRSVYGARRSLPVLIRNLIKGAAFTALHLVSPWSYGALVLFVTAPFTKGHVPLHDVVSGLTVTGYANVKGIAK
jgi:hypothetical protein